MITNLFSQLPNKWKKFIYPSISIKSLDRISNCYYHDINNNKVIYPPIDKIFTVFHLLNPEDIKVIIIGQDCYHGTGEANGIAFSVNKIINNGTGTIKGHIPPSLRNIFKELNYSLNKDIPLHGDLTSWVKQGIFLLNSSLTVEKDKPNSNLHYNWNEFTDIIIKLLACNYNNLVFILWGSFAKKKEKLIITETKNYKPNNHLILKSVHPSPLAANKGGWFGNKHFIKTNRYLRQHLKKEIMWEIQ